VWWIKLDNSQHLAYTLIGKYHTNIAASRIECKQIQQFAAIISK